MNQRNDVIMDESKVFDACALVEEIEQMKDLSAIKIKAAYAAKLLNQALEESKKVGESNE